jgi:7-carboxy-7-deazaguanine synthase
MKYKVRECFLTLQGEGFWTGRPAVFIRFSGCNLWSGHEKDRASAICNFCDTDFVEYTEYTASEIAQMADKLWVGDDAYKMVVLTGGEPLLQADFQLRWELKYHNFYIAVETCVSPKTPRIRIRDADELKLVYPQEKITPDMFNHMPFKNFWLSPMDGPNRAANTAKAVEYCLDHPQWRLNIQTHKTIGIR